MYTFFGQIQRTTWGPIDAFQTGEVQNGCRPKIMIAMRIDFIGSGVADCANSPATA